MFLLIWEWMRYNRKEDCFETFKQEIDWFETKEELLEAQQIADKQYSNHIEDGTLLLTAAVVYSWEEIKRDF